MVFFVYFFEENSQNDFFYLMFRHFYCWKQLLVNVFRALCSVGGQMSTFKVLARSCCSFAAVATITLVFAILVNELT